MQDDSKAMVPSSAATIGKYLRTPRAWIGMALAGTSGTVSYRLLEHAMPDALGVVGTVALGLFCGLFFGWLVNK